MSSSSNSKPSHTTVQAGFTKQPHVLLVDDEELLREVMALMIEEGGGTVIQARDGVEALKLFREQRSKINCVLLDFSMPGRNGFETYKDIILEEPAVKVIMVSGLRVIPEVQTLVLTKKIGFLAKPFHEADLVRAINEALG
jgi:two-component system cell cycle sensor histidine kinase/response regulator CckA